MQQAVYVRRKQKNEKEKNTEKNSPPETRNEIPSSPASASNSRRHARKHVPRVSPYSPASIDSGFVEIGLVQLSQTTKTTNVTHTDRHTDRQTKYITAPYTHPGIKRLFAYRQKAASVASLLRPCLIMKRLFCLPIGKERPHYEDGFLP